MASAAQAPSKKVVLACGGTGGHLFPGIAIAEELQRQGHQCLLLISEKKIDSLAVDGRSDLQYRKIPAIAMPSIFSPKIFPFGFKMWRTLGTCSKILREFDADAVLGMGGFTSLPPVFAGRKSGKRTLIHDSNAIPGKANRLTARFADIVCLGFQDAARYFPKQDVRHTGTPVRSSMNSAPSRHEAFRRFGFDPEQIKRVILVIGGSQGADGINRALIAAFPMLPPEIGIIHFAGPAGLETTKLGYGDALASGRIFLEPFFHEMETAYAAADLVIARSGASTLTELAHFGLPSILIPYPHAADDHQTKNAQIFERHHAAVLMTQENCPALSEELCNLLKDENRIANMSRCARQLAQPDAAKVIANLVLNQE